MDAKYAVQSRYSWIYLLKTYILYNNICVKKKTPAGALKFEKQKDAFPGRFSLRHNAFNLGRMVASFRPVELLI